MYIYIIYIKITCVILYMGILYSIMFHIFMICVQIYHSKERPLQPLPVPVQPSPWLPWRCPPGHGAPVDMMIR